jgi:hypothetical protein
MSRDGKGRVETRQLFVPQEAPMAVKLIRTEESIRLEKEKLKAKVLQYEAQQQQQQVINQ